MEVFKKIIWYIIPFRRRDPDARPNLNLKLMHGINRLAILMFLLAMTYLVIRFALH